MKYKQGLYSSNLTYFETPLATHELIRYGLYKIFFNHEHEPQKCIADLSFRVATILYTEYDLVWNSLKLCKAKFPFLNIFQKFFKEKMTIVAAYRIINQQHMYS